MKLRNLDKFLRVIALRFPPDPYPVWAEDAVFWYGGAAGSGKTKALWKEFKRRQK